MGIFTMLNALPKGAFKEGGGGAGAEILGDDESGDGFEQQGAGLAAAASGWTPALRDCWVPHVASATRSQVRCRVGRCVRCCVLSIVVRGENDDKPHQRRSLPTSETGAPWAHKGVPMFCCWACKGG